jgi:Domain of unknown function (DUF4328)
VPNTAFETRVLNNARVSTLATRSPSAGWSLDPSGGLGVPPLGPRFARLSDLVGQLLLANAALALLTLGVERFVHDHAVLLVLAAVALGLVVTTAGAWCAWQWRMAVSAPNHLRRPPWGHVGAWFIPIANLWRPVENINDLWFAYEPVDDYGWGRDVFIVPWWVSWFAAAVLAVASTGTLARGDVPGVLTAVWAVAAVLAWFVVRRLSWRALLYHVSVD